MKNILNEELERMQYLFQHKRGVVISEQKNVINEESAPGGLGGEWNPSTGEYTIVKGDTLSKIGKAFEVKWMDIWEANKNTLKSGQPNCGKYCGYNWIFAGEIVKIPGKSQTTDNTNTNTTTQIPEKATATGINVDTTFEQLATGAEKMNNQPFYTFAYFVRVVPGVDPRLPNTGQVDGVASPLKTEDFKAKYKEFDTYRFVQTPDGGFKPGMGKELESNAVYGKETINKDKEVPVETQPEKPIEQIEYDRQSQWCKDNTVTADPYLEKCFSINVRPGDDEEDAARSLSKMDAVKGFPYKREQNYDQTAGTFEGIRGPKALSSKELKARENKKPKNMVGGMTRDEFDNDTKRMIEIDQKLEGIGPNERQYLKDLLKNNKGSVLGVGEADDLNSAQRRSLRNAKRQLEDAAKAAKTRLKSEPKFVGETKYVYNTDERKYKSWVVEPLKIK